MTSEPVRTWASTEAAEVWRAGAARRALTLAVATEQLLEAAALRPGMRVLDVAAGTGDQSLLAATRVGPTGSVLATDISESMLEVAAQSAREAGLDNITTQAADASALEVPEDAFDAAICRFGLMFVPDLHQALSRVRRALKPSARFAALVWSPAETNPFMGLQLAIVREMGRLPSPQPSLARAVSLGGPGTLESALRAAGFSDVQVRPVPVPRIFSSVDEALTAMRTTSPAQGELCRDMNEAEQAHYAAELERRVGAYVQADGGCILPGEALLGVGAK